MKLTKYYLKEDGLIVSEHQTFEEAVIAIKAKCNLETLVEIASWDCLHQTVDKNNTSSCIFDLGFINDKECTIERATVKINCGYTAVYNFNEKYKIEHTISKNWYNVVYSIEEDRIYYSANGITFAIEMNGIENPVEEFNKFMGKTNSKFRRLYDSFLADYKFVGEYDKKGVNQPSTLVFTNKFSGELTMKCDGYYYYRKSGSLKAEIFSSFESFLMEMM